MLCVSLVLVLGVWSLWLLFFRDRGLQAIQDHWQVSLTMVFGSMVGGGTSEGGGAIGFPVLTKVLHVQPQQARLFTFAIQSIGMMGASITILANRIPVEWRALRWGVPAAAAGVACSVLLLAPHVQPAVVRIAFTLLLAGIGLALAVQHARRRLDRNHQIPLWGTREQAIVVIVGFAGGVLSGVAGVGENTAMFVALVLLFRVSEDIATPTTVILLTATSLVAFLLHVLLLDDFHGQVVDQWLAAAPVVIVFGPIGALLCTRMSPALIRAVLWFLIAAEVISTWLLVPMTSTARAVFVALLVASTLMCHWLTTIRRYHPRSLHAITAHSHQGTPPAPRHPAPAAVSSTTLTDRHHTPLTSALDEDTA